MSKRVLAAVLSCFGALSAGSASASDACAAVLCMSTNEQSPHECRPYVDAYFNIRVYEKKKKKMVFNPPKTAKKRYEEVLDHCPEARREDRDKVTALYGSLEFSPWGYYDASSEEKKKSKTDSSTSSTSTTSADGTQKTTIQTVATSCADAANTPGMEGMAATPVYDVFPEGSVVIDHQTGQIAIVKDGYVNHRVLVKNPAGGVPLQPTYGAGVQQQVTVTSTVDGSMLGQSGWTKTTASSCQLTNDGRYTLAPSQPGGL